QEFCISNIFSEKILCLLYCQGIGLLLFGGCKRRSSSKITCHSSATITQYFKLLKKLKSDSLDFDNITIGGDKLITEIEEAKFAKNKYSWGLSFNGL
ncbi:hypothetical protein HZS_5997, partial [Henneguya salminicola]